TAEGEKDEGGPRAIALKKGITVVQMTSNSMLGAHGFLARLFAIFEQLEISVDLVTTSEVSVAVTLDEKHNLQELVRRLQPIADVDVRDNQCIVAVVGRNVMRDSSVGARIFDALQGVPISMFSLGTSGLNLSILVDEKDADRAVKSIHRALFETPVGVG
ncbi:MAG: ACT domain-containing protein, partial [Thermoanaerobaculia bacterium]